MNTQTTHTHMSVDVFVEIGIMGAWSNGQQLVGSETPAEGLRGFLSLVHHVPFEPKSGRPGLVLLSWNLCLRGTGQHHASIGWEFGNF